MCSDPAVVRAHRLGAEYGWADQRIGADQLTSIPTESFRVMILYAQSFDPTISLKWSRRRGHICCPPGKKCS